VTAPAIVLALWLGALPSQAQKRATEVELKAAFLVNFAKFTEWPPDALPPGAPVTFCVVDDAAVAGILEGVVASTTIGGRAMSLERRTPGALLPACHVLFVPRLSDREAAAAVGTLKGSTTFSVSDTPALTRAGGVAFFYIEGDQVRFAINVAAAQRARLHISSRMLGLAKIVKDGRP
jgi:hypothetical protein